jgi:CLIP-associating protein 1/2
VKLFLSHGYLVGYIELILSLQSQVSSPTIIVERAGSYAWTHKSWRVREEFVRTLATAVGLFASTELLLQRVFLSPVCQDVFSSYLIWNF